MIWSPCLFRNRDLEEDPASEYPVLPDSEAGYSEYLLDNEEAEPGIFTISLFKDQLFFFRRNPDTIITVPDNEIPLRYDLSFHREVPDRSTVPETVIDQVVEDPAKERICIDFNIGFRQ